MKMYPTLVLLTAAAAGTHGGKIVFKERPRDDRRFGGVDIYPPSTVWGPVQFTSSQAPEIANNSLSTDVEITSNKTELSALCPNEAAWCSEPSNYPEEAIMRAVQKQGESIQILFPKEKKAVAMQLTMRGRWRTMKNMRNCMRTVLRTFVD